MSSQNKAQAASPIETEQFQIDECLVKVINPLPYLQKL